MQTYHKIQTVFKRDMDSPGKKLLEWQWSMPEFKYLANNGWIFTEKVDGTNIRVMFNGETITFGGKTDSAQIPSPLLNRLQERFLPMLDEFKETFTNTKVCLYGEGYGPKIQKNGHLYRDDQDFILFDVYIDGWWLERHNVHSIAQRFNLDVVPVMMEGTLYHAIELIKKGMPSTFGNFFAEGIVARPKIELQTRSGKRIITKIKHRDFT